MAFPKLNPEHKAKAKELHQATCQLLVDRKERTPKGGSFAFAGVIPHDCETELLELFARWLKEGRV